MIQIQQCIKSSCISFSLSLWGEIRSSGDFWNFGNRTKFIFFQWLRYSCSAKHDSNTLMSRPIGSNLINQREGRGCSIYKYIKNMNQRNMQLTLQINRVSNLLIQIKIFTIKTIRKRILINISSVHGIMRYHSKQFIFTHFYSVFEYTHSYFCGLLSSVHST